MFTWAAYERMREMDIALAQCGRWPYWQVERHGFSPVDLGGLNNQWQKTALCLKKIRENTGLKGILKLERYNL